MDDTGAAIPNISIQVSERGIPVDIWVTHRDGWKRGAKDFGKLSRVKILRMEKGVSRQDRGETNPLYEEGIPMNGSAEGPKSTRQSCGFA